MADKILYPACFTDAEWKKLEKAGKVKIRNTGVGATLRDLQKKVEALNKVISTGKGAVPARNAAANAAKAASAQVSKAGGKVKPSAPDKKDALNNLVWQLNRYESEIRDWNPEDHRGLDWTLSKLNDNVRWLASQK